MKFVGPWTVHGCTVHWKKSTFCGYCSCTVHWTVAAFLKKSVKTKKKKKKKKKLKTQLQ